MQEEHTHTNAGIENDTQQLKRESCHPKEIPHANIGIENDTRHARGTHRTNTGIENDTRQ